MGGQQMDTQEIRAFLILSGISGLGSAHIQRLLNSFGSASAILCASRSQLHQVAGISPGLVETLIREKGEVPVDQELELAESVGCTFTTLTDANYPEPLKNIYDPPPVLRMKGTFTEQDEKAIAVVGTRRPTRYGRAVTEQLTRELVSHGFTIVSGLARGVDGIAHRTALEYGGRTVAVLGSGFGNVYPHEHRDLAEEITQQGCVMSEFSMDAAPLAAHFPQRNRVISGLSLGVLITEAAERSGSLITARCAVEQNREVFAVPGDIQVKGSFGPHRLIQQGAALVTGIEDILDALPTYVVSKTAVRPTVSQEDRPDLNPEELAVWNVLGTTSAHIDAITQQMGMPVSRIASILVMMELKGAVQQLPGKHFARKWIGRV